MRDSKAGRLAAIRENPPCSEDTPRTPDQPRTRVAAHQAIPLACGADVAEAHALVQDAVCRYRLTRAVADLSVLGREQFPVPFGDDLDGAIDHLDGRLVVHRVRRTRDAGRPLFRLGHGVARHALLSQVWTDREVDDAQGAVVTGRRSPLDEVLPDPGGHPHAPGA